MGEVILQLLAAAIGSLGFGMIFRLSWRYIPAVSVGGCASWGIYLLAVHFLSGIFIPTLLASAFAALYSEIMARLYKAPATLFVIPAVVPLIPGGALYYTMSYAVQSNWVLARSYGYQTFLFALGIAAGMNLVWVVFGLLGKKTLCR